MNTSTSTLNVAKLAVVQNKNLIITREPGRGTHSMTMSSLREVADNIATIRCTAWHVFEAFQGLDPETEVLVVEEFESADPEIKEIIHSLMEKRSANHTTAMPNLKSVVVPLAMLHDDTKTMANELAGLAPSVVVHITD